jgi:hypothetical protein
MESTCAFYEAAVRVTVWKNQMDLWMGAKYYSPPLPKYLQLWTYADYTTIHLI